MAPPAPGLPQANPIGGAVAGAGKALPIHEGFQQPDRLPIFGLPVLTEAPADLAQNMTGQMRHPHPGKDEKTRVVQDLVPGLFTMPIPWRIARPLRQRPRRPEGGPADHTPNIAGSVRPGCDSPGNGAGGARLPIAGEPVFGWPG